jgi:putative membrane protein
MMIPRQDHERIAAAIRSVEEKTSGEIVCVLARTSSTPAALPIMIAAVTALAVPWPLVALTALPVLRILSLQALTFIMLATVLSLPRVRVALMPRAARRRIAYRAAMEQFVHRGIARTADRSGILIFVSLAEHYVRVIADEGIAAKVPQSRWQAAVDALIAHIREGRVADGFIAAIELCGHELAAHFPRKPSDRNELPNRIYEV